MIFFKTIHLIFSYFREFYIGKFFKGIDRYFFCLPRGYFSDQDSTGTQEVVMALILGIESSCDETAAAVVKDGKKVLSNAVSSQMAKHAVYGGVVPELAAREHLTAIEKVCKEALDSAGRL